MTKNEHLLRARNAQGWTQQELADRLGVTKLTVGRWERGVVRPQTYYIHKMVEILGQTAQQLGFSSEINRDNDAHLLSAQTPQETGALYDSLIPLVSNKRLIGRQRDLEKMKNALLVKHNIVLTASLNGLPGVGKTTLVTTLVHDDEIRRRFPDGILWAPLGPHVNLLTLYQHWGNVLGISETQRQRLQTPDAWTTMLREVISTRAFLIVIDDAWDLRHALALRVGGANCAHVVTTRFPQIAAYLAEEHTTTTLQELNEEESLELLETLAPDVVRQEPARIRTLAHMVGGLPLALTLIGNYLRSVSYSGQQRRLTHALDQLHQAETRLQLSEPHISAENHPSLHPSSRLSLHTILSVTDQRLHGPTRHALYALSVIPAKPSTFSEEAALAIAQCTYDELDELVDAGFLECSENRYRLHQVIADYASLHLHDPEKERVIQQLVTYVHTILISQETVLSSLLETEGALIFAALEKAREYHLHEAYIDIVLAIAPSMLLQALYLQINTYLQTAYDFARTLDDSSRTAHLLLFFGQMHYRQGVYQSAQSTLGEGLAQARLLQEYPLISDFLCDLGGVYWRLGLYAQAKDSLNEALVMAEMCQDRRRTASIYKLLGAVAGDNGDLMTAQDYFKKALHIARETGEHYTVAISLSNIGVIYAQLGQGKEAQQSFLDSLQEARHLQARDHICVVLVNLSMLAIREKQYMQAEEYLAEALEVARWTGTAEWKSVVFSELAAVKIKRGGSHLPEAAHLLQTGLELATTGQARSRVFINLHMLWGEYYLAIQEPNDAYRAFQSMQHLLKEGDVEWNGRAIFGFARVAALKGDHETASTLGQEAVTIFHHMQNTEWLEMEEWVQSLHHNR